MGVSIVPSGKEHEPYYYVPPYDKDVELEPNFFCRARNTKREKYCYARAGQGTDHKGQGRCKNHGGGTPIVHGRYSEVVRDGLGEHLDHLELEDEKTMLEILPEAQLLRALASQNLEDFQKFQAGVIAWNEEETAAAKAEKRKALLHKVPSLTDVADTVKKIAEVVNMVHKQRAANAIGLNDFYRVMQAMAATVATNSEKMLKGRVPQDVLDRFIDQIQQDWRKIKLKSK